MQRLLTTDQHCLLDQVFSLASLTRSLSKLVNGNVWLSIMAITLHDHIILHLNSFEYYLCKSNVTKRVQTPKWKLVLLMDEENCWIVFFFSVSFLQTSLVAIYTNSQLFLSYSLQASCKYLTFYICDSQQHLSYRLSWASLITVPFYRQPWFGMTLFLTHLRMQFLCLNLALIRYVEFFRFLDFLLNNLHFVSSYISLIYSLFFF